MNAAARSAMVSTWRGEIAGDDAHHRLDRATRESRRESARGENPDELVGHRHRHSGPPRSCPERMNTARRRESPPRASDQKWTPLLGSIRCSFENSASFGAENRVHFSARCTHRTQKWTPLLGSIRCSCLKQRIVRRGKPGPLFRTMRQRTEDAPLMRRIHGSGSRHATPCRASLRRSLRQPVEGHEAASSAPCPSAGPCWGRRRARGRDPGGSR